MARCCFAGADCAGDLVACSTCRTFYCREHASHVGMVVECRECVRLRKEATLGTALPRLFAKIDTRRLKNIKLTKPRGLV
jgi:hypothetical protein